MKTQSQADFSYAQWCRGPGGREWRMQVRILTSAQHAGVLACRPGRGFWVPYRQSEMGLAEPHYL